MGLLFSNTWHGHWETVCFRPTRWFPHRFRRKFQLPLVQAKSWSRKRPVHNVFILLNMDWRVKTALPMPSGRPFVHVAHLKLAEKMKHRPMPLIRWLFMRIHKWCCDFATFGFSTGNLQCTWGFSGIAFVVLSSRHRRVFGMVCADWKEGVNTLNDS